MYSISFWHIVWLHLHLVSLGSSWTRLERYWSGKPQPIGIDIQPASIHAVYANNTTNFTILARITPGVDYARSLHELYQEDVESNLLLVDRKINDALQLDPSRALKIKKCIERKLKSAQIHIERELSLLKAQVQDQHNITITSAMIARPHWMWNEVNSMIDEAVQMAGIECWAQAAPSTEMALMNAPSTPGQALIIEHGFFWFRIEQRAYAGGHGPSSSMGGTQLDRFTGQSILFKFARRLVNRTLALPEYQDVQLLQDEAHDIAPFLSAIAHGRWELTQKADQNLPLADRNVSIDISTVTDGFSNVTAYLTGRDILEVGEEVEVDFSDFFQSILIHDEAALKLSLSPDEYFALKPSERIERRNRLAATVPPPRGQDSWYRNTSAVLIFACSQDYPLILNSLNALPPGVLDMASCLINDPCEAAAKGAALQAMEWIGYWEHQQFWERYYERKEHCYEYDLNCDEDGYIRDEL